MISLDMKLAKRRYFYWLCLEHNNCVSTATANALLYPTSSLKVSPWRN